MKKRGFTLIELLAVIVVLAIIAVIATPMVLNTIDEAKRGAAMASATTYINEVEKQVVLSKMDEKNQIVDGTYEVAELVSVKVKGSAPTNGQVTIVNGVVAEARLYIDGYSIDYDGKKVTESNNNYNGKYVILEIDGEELKQEISQKVEFDITDKNIGTSIVCNNGAQVYLEDNKVVVINALGNTTCKANASLKDTIDNLDKTENYILMVNDEVISKTMVIYSGNSIVLELNGKTIKAKTYGSSSTTYNEDEGIFKVAGSNFVINDSVGTGAMLSSPMFRTIQIGADANVVINGGSYEGRQVVWLNDGHVEINGGNFLSNAYGTVTNYKNGNIVINGGNFSIREDVSVTKDNYVVYNYSSGKVDINGGNFVGKVNSTVVNYSTGIVNINQTDKPIYITSLSQIWQPAIKNAATGTINITGNTANDCTSDYTATTSGLCVYAEGDKNYTSNTANTAVANTGDGIININGGTYYGGSYGISNHYSGTINILKGNISSGWGAVVDSRNGIINICNANMSSLKYDLYGSSNVTTGVINYSSNVKFTNGTNTPIFGGITTNIIPNYTGTCISK